MIGSEIGGCRLTEAIGKGGFGSVYKAVQTEYDRIVAIKLLQSATSDESQWFIEEARVAVKLDHPNIVRTHCYGCDSGTYFVVMECLEGKTLDRAILEERRIKADAAVSIAGQIAAALDYAHRAGVVHGDLNPRNIMLAPNGRVVVGDFIGSKPGEQGGRTVVGVPEYLSPEQARGLPATPQSDIYSLGVVFYEMLTGRPPFSEGSVSDTLFRHISSEPEPVDKLNHAIPERLAALVMKMLAKSPDLRPESCEAIVAEVDAIKAHSPASGELHKREHPNPVLVAALVIVLGAIGGVGWLVSHTVAVEREFESLATVSSSASAVDALKISASERYNDEMRRGRDMLDRERYRDAATSFHRACKLKPDQLDPHLYLASIFVRRDDYSLAKAELNAVLKMDPRNKNALSLLEYIRSKETGNR
ncbi:MAG: protein kinase [Armatimonadota bacterium]